MEELSLIPTKDVKVIMEQLNIEQKMINNVISKLKANSQKLMAE